MIRSSILRALLAASLFAPAAMEAAEPDPVQQSPDPQNRLRTLEERVAKIEALLQNHAAFSLLKEFEGLKAELSRMRGVNEMHAHKIETLEKRQGDLYVDLDKRVEDLSKQLKPAVAKPAPPLPQPVQQTVAAAAPQPSVAAAPSAQPPAVAAPQGKPEPARQSPAKPASAPEDPMAESRSYETAFNLFKAGNYAGAITDFKKFLKEYPDSSLAPNAQYWTGYAYYALKDYKNSLAQQQKLVSTWPQSAKVPDALLNTASNQVELNDLASAKKILEEIIARYPGSNAAAIATKRLALLK